MSDAGAIDFCEKIKPCLRRGQVRLYPGYAPDERYDIGDYGYLKGGCFFDKVGAAEKLYNWDLSGSDLDLDYMYIQTLGGSVNCRSAWDQSSGSWSVFAGGKSWWSKHFATLSSIHNHRFMLKEPGLNNLGVSVWNKTAKRELSLEIVVVVGVVESACVRSARGLCSRDFSFSLCRDGRIGEAIGASINSTPPDEYQSFFFQKETNEVHFLNEVSNPRKLKPATPALVLASLDKLTEGSSLRAEIATEKTFFSQNPADRVLGLKKLTAFLNSFGSVIFKVLAERYSTNEKALTLLNDLEDPSFLPTDEDYAVLKWLFYDARLFAETFKDIVPEEWVWRVLDDGDDSSYLVKVDELLRPLVGA